MVSAVFHSPSDASDAIRASKASANCWLFDFEDFCALKMAELCGPTVDTAAYKSKSSGKFCMTIPL